MFEDRTSDIPKDAEYILINNKNKNINDHWMCFLPESILRFGYIKRKVISSRNLEICVIPKTAIQPNPLLTKEFLEKVTEEAINQYSKKQKEVDVNILAVSFGNAPAYRFASVFPVGRFVSVVPGSFLPECIWESIATRRMAENSGYTLEDYRNALDSFSPLRNLDSLKVKSLEIYLGCYDKMIPYQRGKELVEEMERKKLNPKVIIYPFSGHCEAILRFAKNFGEK